MNFWKLQRAGQDHGGVIVQGDTVRMIISKGKNYYLE